MYKPELYDMRTMPHLTETNKEINHVRSSYLIYDYLSNKQHMNLEIIVNPVAT